MTRSPATLRPGVAKRWRSRLFVSRIAAYRIGLVVVAIGLWQALASSGLLSVFWISSPLLLIRRFGTDLADGSLLVNVGQSLYEAIIAFVVASALGIAAGLFVARRPVLEQVLAPFVTGINTMPRVALAPLIILWFGIGALSKIVTACTLVFFILFINVLAAAKNVDQDLVTITRLLGGSDRQVTLKVLLPSAIPWIFAGLRLGLTYSLLGVVVAEILSSHFGIGFIIANSAGTFDTTGVFEGLITLLIIAMALDAMMTAVERRLLKWRPE